MTIYISDTYIYLSAYTDTMHSPIEKDVLRTVISAVKEGLGLRTTPSVVKDHGPQGSTGLADPDLVLRSGKSLILVLMKHRITSDDLAKAMLMGGLQASKGTPKGDAAHSLYPWG